MSIDNDNTGDSGCWTTVWTAMPQVAWAEADHLPPARFARFRGATLRQTVRLCRVSSEAKPSEDKRDKSDSSEVEPSEDKKTRRIRLRFTNSFGTSELCITRATVAIPQRPPGNGDDDNDNDDTAHISGSRFVDPATLRPVLFSGQPSATVPPGGLLLSDPVSISSLPADTPDLSISLYLAEGLLTPPITTHPGSRTQSWLCVSNQTASCSLRDGRGLCSVLHWYFLAGVEEWTAEPQQTIVLLGDSITDGRCSTNNGNDRWPDLLRARLQASGSLPMGTSVTLLNQAAGGNCLLRDGSGGPALLARFDRDVLAQPGVTGVLVCGGINDIGTATDHDTPLVVRGLIATYEAVRERSTTAGLTALFATITPFGGPGQVYASAPAREAARQAVNAWIRSTQAGRVVDFDAMLRDPDEPARLLPAYDSRDHLHPNVAGFQAMADGFPVEMLGLC
ncbi:hypothetical protein SCUCBS95973_005436 [Sporothrix curviconia]|uniref:SGNH hydrolase-type esterase domain-containing protein n=1 Tax=Sporothrix curviconia TaxID=1260050 RepID=A0ABP0BXT5_9PEZI